MSAPRVETALSIGADRLRRGSLVEARQWFRRAAELALDPVAYARAVLGFAGIWVREHRGIADHLALMSMLDRSLAELPASEHVLAARLRVRRAAERTYDGLATIADVREAVDVATSTGDPLAAAESLSLLHHSMLGPQSAVQRLVVAEDLLRNAASMAPAAGATLTLMGLMWRAVDLTLVGDDRASWAARDLKARADEAGNDAVGFIADAIAVMWTIRSGELEDAAKAARRCALRGQGAGDADALGYLGSQLLLIQWLRGTPDGMAPLIDHIAAANWTVELDFERVAATAIWATMLGETERARTALAALMKATATGADRSSIWMVAMFAAGEAAAALGDVQAAREIHRRLTPYAHLPMMTSLGVACMGSAERTLGVAAQTFGDLDAAVRHFEAAIRHNRLLGNRPMAAICEGELVYVESLRFAQRRTHQRQQDVDDDSVRGPSGGDAAISALTAMGLTDRASALRAALDRVEEAAAVPGEVVRRHSSWELRVGAQAVELPDTVGVQRLLQLLERPFVDVAAADLVGGVAPSSRQVIADQRALRAYHEEIRRLRAEIDEAEQDCDLARAERLSDELEAILHHLTTMESLGGHSRTFTDDRERARVTVRKSLSRVFDEVSQQSPQIAEGLAASIRTGVMCGYHPRAHMPTSWRRRSAGQTDRGSDA